MGNHYECLLEESRKNGEKVKGKRRKVEVFFCGAPVVGYELADRCQVLTVRGRQKGKGIEYHFMMEVFG